MIISLTKNIYSYKVQCLLFSRHTPKFAIFIVAFVRYLLEILMEFYRTTFIIFDQSNWECNGHSDHWFFKYYIRLFVIWNLLREKLYLLG